MIKNDFYVLIIYVDKKEYQKKIAEYLLEAFNSINYKAKIIEANIALMSDIAAADLLLLGGVDKDMAISDSGYSEINRAFQGVNLSGRNAGFFMPKDESNTIHFEKMLQSSGINVFRDSLLYDKNTSPDDITLWVDTVKTKMEYI